MDKNKNTSKDIERAVSRERAAKRRSVVSYDNLSPELLDVFKEKYPKGYSDYMEEIFKVDKPDGTFFYAISLEVPDAVYLVKVDVKIDDYEDIERGLFGGGTDDESRDSDEFPDDNTADTFSDDDDGDDS